MGSLCDLQGAPELNGKLATCIRWEAEKERWRVTMQDNGTEKLLKVQNLKMARPLSPGTHVRLVGLQHSPSLNGKSGTCTLWDQSKHRWVVKLEDGGAKFLKPGNLEIAFRTGFTVRLVGLEAASELNGTTGLCVRWEKLRDRWLVRIEGGSEKLLRGENLEVCDSEPPAVAPWVRQTLRVCEEKDKLDLLLAFVKKVRSDEKKGLVERAYMIIFCKDLEKLNAVYDALSQKQFSAIAFREESKQKFVLQALSLDQKRIIVTTHETARSLRSFEHLRHLIYYDFPSDVNHYCNRISRLLQQNRNDGDVDIGFVHSFFTRRPFSVVQDMLSLLEKSKSVMDPALKALLDTTPAPTKRVKRRDKRQNADSGGDTAVNATDESSAIPAGTNTEDSSATPTATASAGSS